MTSTDTLTKKERIEKRRIDRKVLAGKATRTEILRGIDLLQKSERAYAASVEEGVEVLDAIAAGEY